MELVSAAKMTRVKNKSPSHSPTGPIESKIPGSVANMRPGPASITGLSPPCPPANMTTTGIIMNPERMATNVSAATILTAAFCTESLLRM